MSWKMHWRKVISLDEIDVIHLDVVSNMMES